MESIKEFPSGILDQVISDGTATAPTKRAPDPGPSDSTGGVPGNADITVTSVKLQAASHKLQATSNKLQASGEAASSKRWM